MLVRPLPGSGIRYPSRAVAVLSVSVLPGLAHAYRQWLAVKKPRVDGDGEGNPWRRRWPVEAA